MYLQSVLKSLSFKMASVSFALHQFTDLLSLSLSLTVYNIHVLQKCLNVRQKLGTKNTLSLSLSVSLTDSLTHSLTDSLTHSLTHSLINSFTQSCTQSLSLDMLNNFHFYAQQHNVTFYNVSYGFLLHIWMNIVGKHEYFVPKGRIGTDFVVTHSLIHFLLTC